jgi:hypothetical protein
LPLANRETTGQQAADSLAAKSRPNSGIITIAMIVIPWVLLASHRMHISDIWPHAVTSVLQLLFLGQ